MVPGVGRSGVCESVAERGEERDSMMSGELSGMCESRDVEG